MKEKKKVLLILGVLIAVISVVGISYAAWQLTKVQSGKNVVTTGCFHVEFTDKNPISLTNAYPILNEEGKKLTPYEFTITNTCESEASYQVNLEVLNDSTLTELGYIREMLNEQGSTSNSKILTKNKEVEKTLENASSSYKLKQGVLGAKESKTFEFRLWMDQDTPAIPSVMNKELNSKITVITSYKAPIDTTNMMVAIEVKEEYDYGLQTYSYTNSTYTQNDKYELNKVIYENTLSPYSDAVEVVDFSVNQDRSVLGYYVKDADADTYVLHIQANGKIKVNPKASYYFLNKYDDGNSIATPIYFEGIENLDTSEVTDMSYMFYTAKLITDLDLSGFDTSNATNMSHMFAGASGLTSLDLSALDTGNVTDMSSMFSGIVKLTSLDVSHFDTTNVTDMRNMFSGMSSLTSLDLSSFITSKVTDMGYMFLRCSNLASLNLSNFDTSSVTDMSDMFLDCSNLTSLNLSDFDTSNVTDMSYMFCGLSSLTGLDLGSFSTSKVTDMSYMFKGMSSLTSLDLNNFDTSSVTNMGDMFSGMSSLTNLDLSNVDTSNVMYMNHMFKGMSSLASLDLSNFDTSNVMHMDYMFSEMSSLMSLNLSNFDTSNVTYMSSMFSNSSNLTNITYGENFIHKESSIVSDMYLDCPANKPTHSSWNGVTW